MHALFMLIYFFGAAAIFVIGFFFIPVNDSGVDEAEATATGD